MFVLLEVFGFMAARPITVLTWIALGGLSDTPGPKRQGLPAFVGTRFEE